MSKDQIQYVLYENSVYCIDTIVNIANNTINIIISESVQHMSAKKIQALLYIWDIFAKHLRKCAIICISMV